EMIDQDVAHDREEPRLEGPGRIVGVPGTVQGHERVLEDILALVRVSDPPAEKAHDRGGYIHQERTIGLAVPTLRPFHPLGPLRTVGSEGLVVHSWQPVGGYRRAVPVLCASRGGHDAVRHGPPQTGPSY